LRRYESGGVVAEGGDLGRMYFATRGATGVNDPAYNHTYPQGKIWRNASTMARQRHEFPANLSVRYLKPGHAWGRTTVGPGHAAGIQKQNPIASFVSRNMSVTVQKNIDVIWWSIGWNVLKTKFQSAPLEIDNQWPPKIGVAVSAHKCDRRSDCPQFVKNRFCANIAKMPDFIGILGHFAHPTRQPIVRVSHHKNAPGCLRFRMLRHLVFLREPAETGNISRLKKRNTFSIPVPSLPACGKPDGIPCSEQDWQPFRAVLALQ
jgi:hypothetical protein